MRTVRFRLTGGDEVNKVVEAILTDKYTGVLDIVTLIADVDRLKAKHEIEYDELIDFVAILTWRNHP